MMDKIAVLIPCYNEVLSVGKVIRNMFQDIDAEA